LYRFGRSSGAVGFVQEALVSDEVVLWGSECLADAAAAATN
jgi:hypothetical protein